MDLRAHVWVSVYGRGINYYNTSQWVFILMVRNSFAKILAPASDAGSAVPHCAEAAAVMIGVPFQ